VWEVLGSHKTQVRGYRIRAREKEEAPTNKKTIFHWRAKRGGLTSLEGATFGDEGKIGG
jgi:hypothetical protein